jgi:hypothetical protein
MIGLVADLIGGSRKLLEDLIYRVRLLELREPERARDGEGQDSRTRAEREMAGAGRGDRWDRHG